MSLTRPSASRDVGGRLIPLGLAPATSRSADERGRAAGRRTKAGLASYRASLVVPAVGPGRRASFLSRGEAGRGLVRARPPTSQGHRNQRNAATTTLVALVVALPDSYAARMSRAIDGPRVRIPTP